MCVSGQRAVALLDRPDLRLQIVRLFRHSRQKRLPAARRQPRGPQGQRGRSALCPTSSGKKDWITLVEQAGFSQT